MDSQLAINTIKESCYRVGYPTHDAEQERRELINESCDYAIECIGKLEQIEQIIKKQVIMPEGKLKKIKEVLNG